MLIPRPEYVERLKSFRDQNLIKVVTGLRRSGKSTLFKLYIDYLKSEGVTESQIIQINFDDPSYTFATAKDLFNYIVSATKDPNKKTYIFLDEVQLVSDFQIAVNGLRQRDNYDVYITGSNAFLLSGELATLLSGRYIEIHMLPLSFQEYLSGLYPETTDFEVLKRQINIQATFMDYLNYGSLPQTLDYYEKRSNVLLPKAIDIHDYLENILSTIVYKDIMLRHSVTDRWLLEKIVSFVLDNIGQPISTKKIVDTLNGNQVKVSFYTVENYISALEECFLIYRANRYDIRGRELLSTGYKYFVTDTGLRNYLLGRTATNDIGQLLENVVYLELIRRRSTVWVGKYDNLEIDFIANSNGQTEYYQISKNVSNEETLARELTPLLKVKDNYPKHLLTLDGGTQADLSGIQTGSVIDWLLAK